MKQSKLLPIPQKEFGFTVDTFNLFLESTLDGERIAHEREQARRRTEEAQIQMFQREP
jgi:hypothetical protein